MDQLIQAFKAILTEAANTSGDLSKTAKFALDNVNWEQERMHPKPASHPAVTSHLQEACENSGPDHSNTRKVADALLSASKKLAWRNSGSTNGDDPDVVAFAPKFSSCSIIGSTGILKSEKVSAGFSLQGPDTYYPPHLHIAEESYWMIGGNGDWRVDGNPWFPVKSGTSVYHASNARHAMQTNQQPLLTIWLWTSYLDSDVIIVRV